MYPFLHGSCCALLLLVAAWTLIAFQDMIEVLDEVRLCTQQHASYKVGGADARGALDDLEAACLFDETITVFAVCVRSDVVTVNDIFAAVVGDPGQRSYVWRVGDGLCGPTTSVDSGTAVGGTKV